jgi:hypothetical protein
VQLWKQHSHGAPGSSSCEGSPPPPWLQVSRTQSRCFKNAIPKFQERNPDVSRTQSQSFKNADPKVSRTQSQRFKNADPKVSRTQSRCFKNAIPLFRERNPDVSRTQSRCFENADRHKSQERQVSRMRIPCTCTQGSWRRGPLSCKLFSL